MNWPAPNNQVNSAARRLLGGHHVCLRFTERQEGPVPWIKRSEGSVHPDLQDGGTICICHSKLAQLNMPPSHCQCCERPCARTLSKHYHNWLAWTVHLDISNRSSWTPASLENMPDEKRSFTNSPFMALSFVQEALLPISVTSANREKVEPSFVVFQQTHALQHPGHWVQDEEQLHLWV